MLSYDIIIHNKIRFNKKPYIIIPILLQVQKNKFNIFNSKRGYQLQVFPASILKFKIIFYQVNYNFIGKPPYFPATCLKYKNFIGGIPLQFYRKWF